MVKRLSIAMCFTLFAIIFITGCTKSEITAEKAVEIAKTITTDSEASKITNYSDPETTRLEIKEEHKVWNSKKLININGKKVWKVTFTTELDPLLGSINVYIDAFSGEIYGTDPRA